MPHTFGIMIPRRRDVDVPMAPFQRVIRGPEAAPDGVRGIGSSDGVRIAEMIRQRANRPSGIGCGSRLLSIESHQQWRQEQKIRE